MMAGIYSLDAINNIIFNGFDYNLPEETLQIISQIALQVGSPDYVKTPVFQKRENQIKPEFPNQKEVPRRKKGNKSMEILDDADWDSLRTFQATKIEEKIGIDAKIDILRAFFNKLNDSNYLDIRNKIVDVIDKLVSENIASEDLLRVGIFIFENASANRFHSKLYADLYSDLISRYEIMKVIFEKNLSNFTTLFDTIEYVDSNENYDKFCEINKVNEKRKSLATFYINLMNNMMIKKEQIMSITRNLMDQIYNFINIDNKKNEVDELTENVFILYKKELYEDNARSNYELIDGFTILEIIQKIASSKLKEHKSLTNKTLFKFMDMIEM